MRKLDPYQNESNWLTKKEVLETRQQMEITDKEFITDFDLNKKQFKDLINGKVKRIKIGKHSPHFDYEIILDGGWYDTRKGDPHNGF